MKNNIHASGQYWQKRQYVKQGTARCSGSNMTSQLMYISWIHVNSLQVFKVIRSVGHCGSVRSVQRCPGIGLIATSLKNPLQRICFHKTEATLPPPKVHSTLGTTVMITLYCLHRTKLHLRRKPSRASIVRFFCTPTLPQRDGSKQ